MNIHVGITGHRVPPKLPDESRAKIEASIARVLEAVKAADRTRAGRFVLVTSLAEGADQIAGDVALRLGFELEVILPFADARDYSNDFTKPETRAHFKGLLERAHDLCDVGGTRANETAAYEAAGLAVLSRSDVLVAVWNGQAASGRGGTAEIVAEAVTRGTPVIVIDPAAPDFARLLADTARSRSGHGAKPSDAIAAMAGVVDAIVATRSQRKS